MNLYRLFDNVSQWGGDWFIVAADTEEQARQMVREQLREQALQSNYVALPRKGKTPTQAFLQEESARMVVEDFDRRVRGCEVVAVQQGVLYTGSNAI